MLIRTFQSECELSKRTIWQSFHRIVSVIAFQMVVVGCAKVQTLWEPWAVQYVSTNSPAYICSFVYLLCTSVLAFHCIFRLLQCWFTHIKALRLLLLSANPYTLSPHCTNTCSGSFVQTTVFVCIGLMEGCSCRCRRMQCSAADFRRVTTCWICRSIATRPVLQPLYDFIKCVSWLASWLACWLVEVRASPRFGIFKLFISLPSVDPHCTSPWWQWLSLGFKFHYSSMRLLRMPLEAEHISM